MEKRLFSIILILILILTSSVPYAGEGVFLAPPGSSLCIEINKELFSSYIKVKKGYVHIKDLQTGKTEIVTRGTLLNRREAGLLKDVLVTERLRPKGTLNLGKTSFGESYVVCSNPDYATRTVQYRIKNNVARNIVFFRKKKPLKPQPLAVINDLKGNPVYSFLCEAVLPERVEYLVHAGLVSSIRHLRVNANNWLKFSSLMTFDFKKIDNFSDQEVTAYFWGKPYPVQFSIMGENKRYIDIPAGAMLLESVKAEGIIPNFLRQEIREAFNTAIQEIPVKMRSLAAAVIVNMPDFVTGAGFDEVRLARYLDVRAKEIEEARESVGKSESLKKIIKFYGINNISSIMKKDLIMSLLPVKPMPVPDKGKVLIRDILTGNIETVERNELINRFRDKALNGKEVICDRLGTKGNYVLGGHMVNGKRIPNMLFSFSRYPTRMVRYIVHNGEINRSSIILCDEDGSSLEDKDLKYAVNANTGELMCHLPHMIHSELRDKLDNVIIYSRLDTLGSLHYGRTESGEGIRVASFTNKKHHGRKVRFRVVNGEVDRTSIVLLNEDGTVYRDTDTRYAVVSGTGEIQCHLPDKIFENLRVQLDGVTVYDRLDKNGSLRFGEFALGKYDVCTFSNYAHYRVKYKVRDGRIDRTTLMLLNEDGTEFTSSRLRYAEDPLTGKMRCHLADIVHNELAHQLNGLMIYDRLSKKGTGSFAEARTDCVYKKFRDKDQRIKFIVSNGRMDRTTVLLLNEDGTLLEDDDIRYVVDPETHKVRCHLPDYLSQSLRDLLDGLVVYDKLDSNGHVWIVPSKESCCFDDHPFRKIRYSFSRGVVDRTTLVLLDDNNNPINNRDTMYAVDLKTGQIKFHLPNKRLTKWYDILDNVEIVNAHLNDSDGILTLRGLTRYLNRSFMGYAVRYKIYKKRIVSISIYDEKGVIVCEEILDEALELETLPAQTDIRYLVHPGRDRCIMYQEFYQKLYADYNGFLAEKKSHRDIVAIMQRRLYELLHKNVYFYLGKHVRTDLQLKLKSQVFRLWLDIPGSSPQNVKERLLQLTELFRECAEMVSVTVPKDIGKIPVKLIQRINYSRDIMVLDGNANRGELDLTKERIYGKSVREKAIKGEVLKKVKVKKREPTKRYIEYHFENKAGMKSDDMYTAALEGNEKFLENAEELVEILEELFLGKMLKRAFLNEMRKKFEDSLGNFSDYCDRGGIALPSDYSERVIDIIRRFDVMRRGTSKVSTIIGTIWVIPAVVAVAIYRHELAALPWEYMLPLGVIITIAAVYLLIRVRSSATRRTTIDIEKYHRGGKTMTDTMQRIHRYEKLTQKSY